MVKLQDIGKSDIGNASDQFHGDHRPGNVLVIIPFQWGKINGGIFLSEIVARGIVPSKILQLLSGRMDGTVLMNNTSGTYFQIGSDVVLLCDLRWGCIPIGISIENHSAIAKEFDFTPGSGISFQEGKLLYGGKKLTVQPLQFPPEVADGVVELAVQFRDLVQFPPVFFGPNDKCPLSVDECFSIIDEVVGCVNFNLAFL